MSRYIDADDLKAVVKANDWSNPVVPVVVGHIIDRLHTADVVEVVRCKDCKYYDDGECDYHSEPKEMRQYERWTFDVSENDYCRYGERREE